MVSFMVIVSFVGHYNDTVALDAVGLGTSVANVFGVSIVQGLGTALDTLASQAFGGDNKRLVSAMGNMWDRTSEAELMTQTWIVPWILESGRGTCILYFYLLTHRLCGRPFVCMPLT